MNFRCDKQVSWMRWMKTLSKYLLNSQRYLSIHFGKMSKSIRMTFEYVSKMLEAATARNNKTVLSFSKISQTLNIASMRRHTPKRCVEWKSPLIRFVSFSIRENSFVCFRSQSVCSNKSAKREKKFCLVKMCKENHLIVDQRALNKWIHEISNETNKTDYGATV